MAQLSLLSKTKAYCLVQSSGLCYTTSLEVNKSFPLHFMGQKLAKPRDKIA